MSLCLQVFHDLDPATALISSLNCPILFTSLLSHRPPCSSYTVRDFAFLVLSALPSFTSVAGSLPSLHLFSHALSWAPLYLAIWKSKHCPFPRSCLTNDFLPLTNDIVIHLLVYVFSVFSPHPTMSQFQEVGSSFLYCVSPIPRISPGST